MTRTASSRPTGIETWTTMTRQATTAFSPMELSVGRSTRQSRRPRMAEKTVRLEGGNGIVLGTVNGSGHAASLPVDIGQAVAFVTLNAATGNTTGATMDANAAQQFCCVVAVGTGTLAGTLTIEMSLDGITWVTSGTTVALTA